MQLLVFRHGIAEDDSAGGSDFSRQLTDEGVDRTRRAAAGLRKVAPSPQVILTSPKVRARQTADLAGEAFDRSPLRTCSPRTTPWASSTCSASDVNRR